MVENTIATGVAVFALLPVRVMNIWQYLAVIL